MKPITKTPPPVAPAKFDSRTWYAFELGREWKLSLAEIEALFGYQSIVSVNPKIAVIQTERDVVAIAGRMGGIIRAFKIDESVRDARTFPHDVTDKLMKMGREERITFGLGMIGVSAPIFSQGLRIKKDLKDRGFNLRLVNKDDQNPVSAVVKKEGLVASGTEFFLLESDRKLFLAHTIHIQDIDAYAARDMGKSRDMEVGMLPPKLAQSMINLALGTTEISDDVRLYDPFCGLGTVPIEGLHMGISYVYASDISPEMVAATDKSVAEYVTKVTNGGPSINPLESMVLDAKNIIQFPSVSKATHMATEGYLGRIFGQHSIKADLVEIEKKNLIEIYGAMFAGLASIKWSGVIVMTIPCWETKESSIYFGEFYHLLERYGYRADPLLADRAEVKLTKFGSLIYRRPGQTVGREVVRIVRR